MKRDLLVSIAGHLILAAILLIVRPTSGTFRGNPDIMTVSFAEFTPTEMASKAQTSNQPFTTPKPLADEKVNEPVKLDSPDKKEKLSQEEPKKDKGSNESKGGIDVSSKVGAGSSTAEGDNIGGANLPYNLGLVLSVIERSWRNPVTSQTAIFCTIYCKIDRSGSLIGEPTIEKSSGIAVFDQSAVYAIKRAGQFPPFPTDFEYDFIGLHLDFEYAP